ncbi:hypothetical protein CBS147353_4956 [Aspergillus niger]|nr:hypothetical protein CBS147353_4956 [Aspergillus niger]
MVQSLSRSILAPTTNPNEDHVLLFFASRIRGPFELYQSHPLHFLSHLNPAIPSLYPAEKPATKTFANDPDDVSDYDSEDDYSDDDTQQKPQQQQQQQQQQRRRRRPQQQNPNDEDDTYYSDEYSDDYDDYDDDDDDYYDDDEEEEVQAMERYQPTTISSRDNVPAQPIANGGMQEAEGKTGDDWEDQDGMKLKLELNLDIEVELKAHIHGDLTLSLLA